MDPRRLSLRGWLCLSLFGLILAATGSAQVLPSGFTSNGTIYGWWGNDALEASGTGNVNGFVSNLIWPNSPDAQWNLYNPTSDKLIQVWSGTTSSGSAAYAFSVSLNAYGANFSGGAVGVLIDWRGNGTVDLGAVVTFTNNAEGGNGSTTYSLYTVATGTSISSAGNQTQTAGIFNGATLITTGTFTNTQIAGTVTSNRVTFSHGTTSDSVSFFVAQGDANTTAAGTWDIVTARAAGGNTLFSAFTEIKSGDVNVGPSNSWDLTGDYVGSGSTMQFGTLNVPDTPTNLALAGLLSPAIWIVIRRRRQRR